jgi:hypothetical protein
MNLAMEERSWSSQHWAVERVLRLLRPVLAVAKIPCTDTRVGSVFTSLCRECWFDKGINMHRHNLFAVVEPVLTTIRTPFETCCNKASFGHCSVCRIGKMLEDYDHEISFATPGISIPAWSVRDAV